MNLMRTIFLTLIMLIVASFAFGQETALKDSISLSLVDAQKYAAEYNRAILASKIDVEKAKKIVMETTAIGLPQVNLKADYQHQFVVPELDFGGFYNFSILPPDQNVTGNDLMRSYIPGEPVPLGVKDNTTFTLSVSQLIFSGEYIVGLQASRVYKELSEQGLAVSELKVKESVANSYYIVLVLDENITILKESRDLVAKTLDEMSKMREQGFTEDTDIDQLKINLSNLETLILSLSAQRIVSVKLLKLQIGMDIQQPIKLTNNIESIISSDNKDYLTDPEFILDSSPTYKLLIINESLQMLNVKREKSKYLPTIAGFYQHQEKLNQPAFDFMPKDLIGITASIPIVTSGQRISRIKQAELELDKARLNKDQAGQGMVLEFELALNTYQIAYKNYLTNKESLDLSVKIYQKNNIKYKEGLISSLDLTQSQNQFLNAQQNYYQSVVNYLNAKVAIDRILSK